MTRHRFPIRWELVVGRELLLSSSGERKEREKRAAREDLEEARAAGRKLDGMGQGAADPAICLLCQD